MLPARLLLLTSAVASFASAQTPRAPQRQPDLSGTYDIATLTPLVRPAHFGDRLTLTGEEARELSRKAQSARAAQNQPSDPSRQAPDTGNVGSYNDFWYDRGAGAFQIDGKWRTSIITDPPNGQRPELTAEGQRRAAERARVYRPSRGDAYWITEGISPGPYDDPELLPPAERCLLAFGSSAGPPMLRAAYNNLKKIVQTKDTVMILNEMVHDVRIIRINGQHEPPDVRRWLGDSIGRWEGDTLVVDTTNFNDTPALAGATRNLRVVERFRRIDERSLLYQFTVEDPTIWTRPWSGEILWPATNDRIFEYACHEGNYSFAGILRGARLLETEAEKKKAAGVK
jgi:hypothetical protein